MVLVGMAPEFPGKNSVSRSGLPAHPGAQEGRRSPDSAMDAKVAETWQVGYSAVHSDTGLSKLAERWFRLCRPPLGPYDVTASHTSCVDTSLPVVSKYIACRLGSQTSVDFFGSREYPCFRKPASNNDGVRNSLTEGEREYRSEKTVFCGGV